MNAICFIVAFFLLHCICLIKLYFFNKNFVNNVLHCRIIIKYVYIKSHRTNKLILSIETIFFSSVIISSLSSIYFQFIIILVNEGASKSIVLLSSKAIIFNCRQDWRQFLWTIGQTKYVNKQNPLQF